MQISPELSDRQKLKKLQREWPTVNGVTASAMRRHARYYRNLREKRDISESRKTRTDAEIRQMVRFFADDTRWAACLE